jgi:hypothetical protein
MKFQKAVYKYFFSLSLTHLIFSQAIAHPILSIVEYQYQPIVGNIFTVISFILMILSIALFSPTFIFSVKNKHAAVAVLSLFIVTYTIFWLYISIYDAFFLTNTQYVTCMQEFNDITHCEGI